MTVVVSPLTPGFGAEIAGIDLRRPLDEGHFEIVQDAFVQLYRNWSSVGYPVTYLRIAVVNGCRSHGRRRALERRHPPAGHEPIVYDTAAIAVRDALRVLTPRQRAAVVLRYFDDRSEADVASLLGISVGTVKSTSSRAIAQLRDFPGLAAIFATTDSML